MLASANSPLNFVVPKTVFSPRPEVCFLNRPQQYSVEKILIVDRKKETDPTVNVIVEDRSNFKNICSPFYI